MNAVKLSREYYKKFSQAEGNQHIAGLFAIEKILKLTDKYNPKNILELGLGIGSISYSIIDFLDKKGIDYKYYGTEANEFCLNQLPINLKNKFNKILLFEKANKLPKNLKFDFVIVDGSDESIKMLKNIVSNRAIIFIEGFRGKQVELIKSIFPKSLHVTVISSFKNPSYGPFDQGKWSGGGQLIFINPNLYQKLHFFYEKINTSFKYKVIRKLKAN